MKKSLILKHLSKLKKNLKEVTFISEPAENIFFLVVVKDFFPKKRLPRQESELASGNLERYCKPMSFRGGVTGKLGN